MVAVTLWAGIVLVGVAAILLIPLFVAISSRFSLVNEQISSLEQRGVVLSPVDVASLQERVGILSRKLTTKEVPPPTRYIEHIRGALTSGNVLSGFVFAQGVAPVVEVSGVATTRQALQAFVTALEQNPAVASVESPVSNYVKSTNSQFNLTITFLLP